MMDWLKATAAAFTAVTALVALFIAFIYRCGGHLEPREPDDIQDYLSPDGNYVATVKTESGGHLVGWYCFIRFSPSCHGVDPGSAQSGQTIPGSRR
jgi:hypothetical protein